MLNNLEYFSHTFIEKNHSVSLILKNNNTQHCVILKIAYTSGGFTVKVIGDFKGDKSPKFYESPNITLQDWCFDGSLERVYNKRLVIDNVTLSKQGLLIEDAISYSSGKYVLSFKNGCMKFYIASPESTELNKFRISNYELVNSDREE